MQLGFAVWPLMRFTGERAKMGEFANPLWIKILGWTVAAIIIVLNVKLLFDTFMPEVARRGLLRLPWPAVPNNFAMYQHILIPLENSAADQAILDHIKPLAKLTGASLLLMHVADGWVARNYDRLNLAESEEMRQDRAYLETRAAELRAEGFTVDHLLALGDPADEMIKAAAAQASISSPCPPTGTASSAICSTAVPQTKCGTWWTCLCFCSRRSAE